jgi:ribosomal protein L29
VGSQVTGQVTKIEAISKGKRTIAALDADFTPERKVEISFNDLALPDGTRFQLQTSVSPGSGQLIRFGAAAESKERKGAKDAASERTRRAKEQAKQEWDKAMKQLKTPGRMQRLRRYVEAQLPVHAQYIPAGTVYFAELDRSLDFGTEMMTPQMASSMGGALPPGGVVHARLITL